MLGDVDDQAQVGANHPLAGGRIVVRDDQPGQFLFLVGGEQRRVVDLPQVQLEAGLDGGGSHRPYPSSLPVPEDYKLRLLKYFVDALGSVRAVRAQRMTSRRTSRSLSLIGVIGGDFEPLMK